MNQGTTPAVAGVMAAAFRTGLFVSVCTIQIPSGGFNDAGQPDGLYANVTGLVNIPCTSAPMSEVRIQAVEMKSLADIEAFAPRHVLLGGYFPTLEAGVSSGWRAIIDGQTWDLMGAESDSQKQMTRIAIRASAI